MHVLYLYSSIKLIDAMFRDTMKEDQALHRLTVIEEPDYEVAEIHSGSETRKEDDNDSGSEAETVVPVSRIVILVTSDKVKIEIAAKTLAQHSYADISVVCTLEPG
jgi:hypothetical protein